MAISTGCGADERGVLEQPASKAIAPLSIPAATLFILSMASPDTGRNGRALHG